MRYPSMLIISAIITGLPALLAAPLVAGGPGTLKFDEDSISVLEEAGTVTVLVERSQGEDGVVSVDYHTATGGSATAGADFTATSGTLTWADQDESSKSFTVAILDDGVAEGAETIALVLSNATGGASVDSERGTSTIFIQASDGGTGGDPGDPGDPDDDRPGTLKFDESSFEVFESAGVAIIAVERSRGERGVVTVGYRASAGSATAGSDFTTVSGTLTWPHLDGGAKTFTVPILDDALAESTETVELSLFDPTGGAGIDPLRGTAVVRILDDDGGPGDPGDPGR